MADVALKYDKETQKFLYEADESASRDQTKRYQPHSYADGFTAYDRHSLVSFVYEIPNKDTRDAIRETESGVDLVYFENSKDFFDDLGI